jgi:hypothetical protein
MAFEVEAVFRFEGLPPEEEEADWLIQGWPGQPVLVEWIVTDEEV